MVVPDFFSVDIDYLKG